MRLVSLEVKEIWENIKKSQNNMTMIIELYLSEIGDKPSSINESDKSYPGWSRYEWEASHSLRNDDQIVIKPADKVSAIVACNKKDYLMVSSSHLNDTTVSQMCQSTPLQKVNEEILIHFKRYAKP